MCAIRSARGFSGAKSGNSDPQLCTEGIPGGHFSFQDRSQGGLVGLTRVPGLVRTPCLGASVFRIHPTERARDKSSTTSCGTNATSPVI